MNVSPISPEDIPIIDTQIKQCISALINTKKDKKLEEDTFYNITVDTYKDFYKLFINSQFSNDKNSFNEDDRVTYNKNLVLITQYTLDKYTDKAKSYGKKSGNFKGDHDKQVADIRIKIRGAVGKLKFLYKITKTLELPALLSAMACIIATKLECSAEEAVGTLTNS